MLLLGINTLKIAVYNILFDLCWHRQTLSSDSKHCEGWFYKSLAVHHYWASDGIVVNPELMINYNNFKNFHIISIIYFCQVDKIRIGNNTILIGI